MKREHIVPLAPQAVDLLRQLRAMPGVQAAARLFPSPSHEGCMSNNTMLYAMYRMGYDPRLFGRMLATVALRCGTIARIWRANRIAARAANFIETHLETAHAATFVKITAPSKPCAPRAFIFIVCIARHSSDCECEQRQDSYFSHVRFHVLLAAGAALALYAARHFR
jgi:hypothetical protein